ncbi:Uncharacterised protein [Mycobacteroides abscessus subsp. abscessus]|nr:Uncharacterised protein [Mycobacteroides abscessus subsp. abscessus]
MTNEQHESVLISVHPESIQTDGVDAVEKRHEEDARWYLTKKYGYAPEGGFDVWHGAEALDEFVRTHPELTVPEDRGLHHMLYRSRTLV